MSAELPHEKKGTWTMFVLKLVFFIGAFFLIIFTILANMGGKSDALKASIEEFARESTGLKAEIGTLNNMNFFPTIAFDFENMNLFRKQFMDAPAAHIDRLKAAMGFWDVAFSNGHMKILEVHGVKIMPGILLDKTVLVDSAAIVDEGGGKAAFEGKGSVGSDPLKFSMQMEPIGSGRSKKYRFGEERALNIAMGPIMIEAVLRNGDDPYLMIDNLKISLQGQDVITGKIGLNRRTTQEMKFTGEITFPEHGTVLKPELIFDVGTRKFSGTLSSDNFSRADFAAGSAFDRFTKAVLASLGDAQEQKDFLDKFFAKQDIKLEAKGAQSFSGPVVFKNNLLKTQ